MGDYAAVALSGGLASDGAALSAAWKANPYLDAGGPLGDDARWFVGSRLDLFGPQRLTFRFGADWASSFEGGGRLVPVSPPAGSSRALYAYAFEEYETFTTTASVRKRFGAVAAAEAGAVAGLGWIADWIDEPTYGAAQRLVLDLEYRGTDESYGGRIDASVGFSQDDFEAPVVDLSGFLRFAPSARFVLDLRDILAAFALSDGRERYDPYLSAGFRADVRIQISL